MKKTLYFILIIITLIINWNCNGQEKTIYHEYQPTASDFAIVEWDINKEKLPENYVIEKIDSENRVIELKFYQKGENNFEHLCYLTTWIKYEYPNNKTIIQYNLNNEGKPEANMECEKPSKITYHLNKNKKQIINTEYEFKFNHQLYLKNGWSENEIAKTIKELKKDKNLASFIAYYSKSIAKLNGVFPIKNDFDIEKFYFNDKESSELKVK